MPIYEYQCITCGGRLEKLQKISEPALTDCPACGQSTLQKLVSHTSFQLKGTGWYVTDFRDKGKEKPVSDQEANEDNADKKPTDNKVADQATSKNNTTENSGSSIESQSSSTAASSTDSSSSNSNNSTVA